MGLGATLKVAMDTTAVRRGLSSIRGMFKRLSGALRGFAGAMRKSLVPVVGLLAGLGFAVKKQIDFARELKNVTDQTGVAAQDVLALRDAFQRLGVEVGDDADILSDFQEKIESAVRGDGTAQEGLNLLRIRAQELHALQDPMTQLVRLMDLISGSTLSIQGKAFVLDKVFGGQGFKLVPLAEDFRNKLEESRTAVAGIAERLDGGLMQSLMASNKALVNLRVQFRHLMLEIVSLLPLQAIADLLSGINLSKMFGGLQEFFKDPSESLKNAWRFLSEKIRELWRNLIEMLIRAGEKLGEAIGAGLKAALGFGETAIEKAGLGRALQFLKALIMGPPAIEIKSDPPGKAPGLDSPLDMKNKKMEDSLQDINRHLERLNRQGGARFA